MSEQSPTQPSDDQPSDDARELGPAAVGDQDPEQRGEQPGRPVADRAPEDPLDQPVAGGDDDGEPAQGVGAPDSW